MTAQDMIKTLRVCGNDPRLGETTCDDCPFHAACSSGADHLLEAAGVIEQLVKENEALKKRMAGLEEDSRVLGKVMGVGEYASLYKEETA